MQSDNIILIDSRGRGESMIHSLLSAKGLPCKKTLLESGDYIVNGIGFERKEASIDLIKSVVCGTKHLWAQLERLKRSYVHYLLIIEGKLSDNNIEKGIIRSVTVRYGVPIVYTKNMHDTANFLETVYYKYDNLNVSTEVDFVCNKRSQPDDIRLEMLQCVNGIGKVTAQAIIDKTDLFSDDYDVHMIANIREQLLGISRINEGTADLLIQTLYGYSRKRV
jgi:ERCC4-type nuclease